MLDPWITARGRWKKALARAGYERASWRAATALHALTQREAADIRRESGRSDSLVIPNAGPDPLPHPAEPRPPHIVYIGRIHPKKNLLALIEGWRLAERPSDARLTLAGWGEAADVAAVEAAVAGAPGVSFAGPVFGAAKQALIDGARFVVLPSLSEGLPMALLEAWAAGVPTIHTAECNLPEGLATGAALECGYDPPNIAAALTAALSQTPDAWRAMSEAARSVAGGRFSAQQVAGRWGEVYASAIDGVSVRPAA